MVAISVLMSVYNGEGELQETIDSILAQSERDFEFLIVDDGSTDGTAAVLEAQRDPRIRVIRQHNAGLTAALIRAASEARGTYLARQDCGDVSLPTRLARQRALLDADSGLAFVSCWTEFVGPENEPMDVKKGTGIATRATRILDLATRHGMADGPTCHASVVMRRDAYERAGGYRAAFYYAQDWDLWYRLAEVGTFQMIAEVLYRYRVMPGGISIAARGPQFEFARLSETAARARARGESDAAILALAAAVLRGPAAASGRAAGLYFIGEALRRNGDIRARRYLLDSIKAAPFSPRAWVRYLQSLTLG